jgi:hypothetical protein
LAFGGRFLVIDVTWDSVHELHIAYRAYDDALRRVPWSRRGANIPEALTEALVCLCTDGKLKTSGEGDLLLPDGRIGEVKATSKPDGDLSSFSPQESWDTLFFVIANPGDGFDYHVYDTEMSRSDFGVIQVSKAHTFNDQAMAKRRPRFSIIEKVISEYDMEPTWRVDIQKRLIGS